MIDTSSRVCLFASIHSRKSGWRARCVSALAIAAALTVPVFLRGGPVVAEEQAEAPAGRLGEVIVTARYRQENLQQTPLAITALQSESLEDKSFTNIADVASVVPNAFFREASTVFGPSTQAYIRDVGQGDFKLSFEPGVAMYIDDVYYSDLLGSQFDLMDLERVEVLRGPQGTLFGKNAIGGAVRMISKKPSGDNTGSIQATYGRYNRIDVRASYDFSLIQDTLFLRVAGMSKHRQGYQTQLDFTCDMIRRGTPELAGIGDGIGADGSAGGGFDGAPDTVAVGSAADNAFSFPIRHQGGGNQSANCVIGRFGGEDVQGGRVSARLIVSDTVEVNVSADYTDDESSVNAQSLFGVGVLNTMTGQYAFNTVGTTTNLPPTLTGRNNLIRSKYGIQFDSRFITGDPYTSYATYDDPIGGRVWPPVASVENWGVAGTIDWDVTDAIHAKWINAFRRYDASFVTDNDGSPVLINTVWTTQNHKQWTSELQLTGNLLDGNLEWTAGAFYFDSNSFNGGRVISLNGILDFDVGDTIKASNKSGFLHLVYHVTDKLSATAGIRYSDDKKTYSFFHNPLAGFPPNPIFAPPASQSRWDWTGGLNYQVTDAAMVYGQVSTGFRAPGFNPRPFTPEQLLPIPGESLTSYEIGAKTDWLENRLRLNVAAFYSDYGSRVITRSQLECLPPFEMTLSPCPGPTAPWLNFLTGPAEVTGFEVELTAEPVQGLLIDGAMGYSHFKSKSGDLIIDGVPRKLTGLPEWTANLGAQYEVVIGNSGSITPRLDWFYTGTIYYDPRNLPLATQPSHSVFNGRITYQTADKDWSLVLSVTNLTNKFYYLSIDDFITSGLADIEGQPARPREWAITVKRNF